MNAGYREKRVKFTLEMEKEVYKLLKSESDTDRKKKHPAKWYREIVAKKLKLNEPDNPSLRSYEDLLRRIKSEISKAVPLDNPWSIAACSEYKEYFPSESIPFLTECIHFVDLVLSNKKEQNFPIIPLYISIGLAIWIARIKPVMQLYFPETNFDRDNFLYMVITTASYYQFDEDFYIANGKNNFDSSLLDMAVISGNFYNVQKVYYGENFKLTPIEANNKLEEFYDSNYEKIKNRDKQIKEFKEFEIKNRILEG